MAIPHAQEGEAIDVRPLGAALAQEISIALFKSDHLEVLRLVVLAGKAIPPHAVDGDIVIHCIEGAVAITQAGQARMLDAGKMLFLRGGVMHGVEASRDSQVLLTVALRRPAETAG